MSDHADTIREQFVAVTDPLDMWLVIDGNYVRPATKQESALLARCDALEQERDAAIKALDEIGEIMDNQIVQIIQRVTYPHYGVTP